MVHLHQEIMIPQLAIRKQHLIMTTLQIEWEEAMVAMGEIKTVEVTDVTKEEADLAQEIEETEDPPEAGQEAVIDTARAVAAAVEEDTVEIEAATRALIKEAAAEISILLKHNLAQDTEKILVENAVDRAVVECALIQFMKPSF